MRILYLIIFLLSICGNELILEYVIVNEKDVTYFELSSKDQSEKEFEDIYEDDYFISDASLHFLGKYPSALNEAVELILRLTPHLEINSPPPES